MLSLIPEGIAIIDKESKELYYSNNEFRRILSCDDENLQSKVEDKMKEFIF